MVQLSCGQSAPARRCSGRAVAAAARRRGAGRGGLPAHRSPPSEAALAFHGRGDGDHITTQQYHLECNVTSVTCAMLMVCKGEHPSTVRVSLSWRR